MEKQQEFDEQSQLVEQFLVAKIIVFFSSNAAITMIK